MHRLEEATTATPRTTFDTEELRLHWETLLAHPFSDATEKRAIQLAAVAGPALLWAAGLTNNKFLGLEFGDQARDITWVLMATLAFAVWTWATSAKRDYQRRRIAIGRSIDRIRARVGKVTAERHNEAAGLEAETARHREQSNALSDAKEAATRPLRESYDTLMARCTGVTMQAKSAQGEERHRLVRESSDLEAQAEDAWAQYRTELARWNQKRDRLESRVDNVMAARLIAELHGDTSDKPADRIIGSARGWDKAIVLELAPYATLTLVAFVMLIWRSR